MADVPLMDGPRTAAGRYVWAGLSDDRREVERLEDEEAPEIMTTSGVTLSLLRRLLARRFPSGGADLDEIGRYVADARTRGVFDPSAQEARTAEAIIRWLFGDAWIAAGISSEEGGRVMGGVIADLVEDLGLGAEEVLAMILAAEEDPGSYPGL